MTPTRPAKSTVTARDVAREAGVSTGTVSRVINAHPAVTEDVRRKVLSAVERLGWQPNAVARSMRTARTRTIGCVFSDFRNPLYANIMQGAEEALAADNYTLMVASSGGSAAREASLIGLFASRRTDGLILSISDERDPRIVEAIRAARLPTVLIEREIDVDAYSVGTDHRGGIRKAVEYLFSLRHERIALLTGGQSTRAGLERLAGFIEAHKRAGKAVDPAMLRLESLSSDYAFSETQSLMEMKAPPTAILAGGNLMLAGVLRAAHILNLRLPQDLSVVCSGDTELAELATPSVTAIRWDLGAVGHRAASLLLSNFAGATIALGTRIELPNEIVLRGSCCPPFKANF